MSLLIFLRKFELRTDYDRGVQIVDTTCPWVSKVWNAVDNHRKAGQTRLIVHLGDGNLNKFFHASVYAINLG